MIRDLLPVLRDFWVLFPRSLKNSTLWSQTDTVDPPFSVFGTIGSLPEPCSRWLCPGCCSGHRCIGCGNGSPIVVFTVSHEDKILALGRRSAGS